ncbi:hypothetical protein [Corallococcus sp. CA054B]|uniref:hypothetical protein n=1 Tax=Corallococcus sp. CA054B TaxID=2316734 RepID=UPI0011C3644B|nr:hypothetical protein [Corallococcus sp. CA054B]
MTTISRLVLLAVSSFSTLATSQELQRDLAASPGTTVAEQVASPEPNPTPISVKVVELPTTPPQPTTLTIDNLKSGKLIEYGFSIGAGYAVHVPLKGLTEYAAQDTTSSFMPYVVGYPFLFLAKSGPETRAYCAAVWSLSSRDVARARADRMAKDRTKKELEREQVSDDEVAEETGWRLGGDAVCGYRLIGVYLGKPSSISPTIRPDTNLTDGTPSATSIISTGLAYSPNIAISILGGMSLWRFSADPASIPNTDVPPNRNRSFWTFTLALGGNTDVFSALLK